MNFLAHLYLSGEFDEGMLGNLMADFVKGSPPPEWSQPLRRGIFLHREIDSFTDAHPVVRESKARLSPTYRHYSAVIVDIFYDHFLAVHWHRYHDLPLAHFAREVYQLLNEKWPLLPESMHLMAKRMQQQNWLTGYAQLTGIERVFRGMARRTRFVSGMERATEDLRKDYPLYEGEFLRFFPDLVRHVTEWEKKQQ